MWCRHQKFRRIAIVDDGVAADPFMQDVLRMAAPPDLRVEVFTVAEGIESLGVEADDRVTTMVLMKSPHTARHLYDGGLVYRALNIGGMGSAPGRKSLYKNIAASEEEITILRYLRDQGVTITLLTVPGEKPKAFSDIVGKS